MKYFQELPRVAYPRIEDSSAFQYQQLTNILSRSAFLQEVVENTGMFYDYDVKDGETPELIAHKLYGSVERFWLVLLFNKLMNPYYDFPLTSDELNSHILSKYGYSAETAQITTHHYERRVKRTVLVNGAEYSSNTETVVISSQEANSTTGLAETNPYLPGTPDTVNTYETVTDTIPDGEYYAFDAANTAVFAANASTTSVVTEFTIANVSVYTYELNENEKRRTIRLLDAKYAGTVEQEFKRLMGN